MRSKAAAWAKAAGRAASYGFRPMPRARPYGEYRLGAAGGGDGGDQDERLPDSFRWTSNTTFFGPGGTSSWPHWGTACGVRCGDGNRLVPLDEVADPASWRGERQLGRQTIRLDTIIGAAEPRRNADRRFRPTCHRVRFRWERLALAQRRGEPIPPIEVYRVCDRHFVIDGHHRISIAAAAGERHIEAYVTQVLTAVPSGPGRAPAHADRPARAVVCCA